MSDPGKAKGVLGLLAMLLVWSLTASVAVAEWGMIMAPPAKANIRAKRSVDSALKGQLQPGETIRADFLQGGWYAVFLVTEERRDEALARGYVLATLLKEFKTTAEAAKIKEPAPAAKPPSATSWPWGRLMAPVNRLNIRATRSVDSALKGQLQPGKTVKVDFLQGGWYAVFPVTEERRDETLALGYVYAPLLREPIPQTSAAPTEAAKPPAPAPPAPDKKAPFVTVEEIAVQIDSAGKERFIIRFDRFYIPFLTGIEGARPKIILEIPNTAGLAREWEVIEPQGVLIRKVQSHWDPRTRLSRIVLDMDPAKNYFVKPMLFEENNTYCLDITEDNSGKGQP